MPIRPDQARCAHQGFPRKAVGARCCAYTALPLVTKHARCRSMRSPVTHRSPFLHIVKVNPSLLLPVTVAMWRTLWLAFFTFLASGLHFFFDYLLWVRFYLATLHVSETHTCQYLVALSIFTVVYWMDNTFLTPLTNGQQTIVFPGTKLRILLLSSALMILFWPGLPARAGTANVIAIAANPDSQPQPGISTTFSLCFDLF